MAIYTFHLSWNDEIINIDLANDHVVWIETIRFFGEYIRDLRGEIPNPSEIDISVVAEDGSKIVDVKFSARRSVRG